MGTTAHPLQMGILLAALIPLLAAIKSITLRLGLAILFAYGILTATARTATVLSAIAILYLVLLGSKKIFRTILLVGMAMPVALALFQSRAFFVISSKFKSDGGSTQLRADAAHWAWVPRDEFMVFGYPGARDLRQAGVLASSLENAYLMAGLSFGLVFAAGLAFMHLSLLLVPMRRFRWDLVPYASGRSPVRAGVRGLCAVAVLLVVAYHITGWPSGGFVGVDVFFVVSGYLISGILLRQASGGAIDLPAFYARPIRRIVSFAVLVTLVTVATRLAEAGSAPIVLGSPPTVRDPRLCLNRITQARGCTSEMDRVYERKAKAEHAAAQAVGVAMIDVRTWTCAGSTCPLTVGHYLTRTDTTHVTAAFAAALGPVLRQELEKEGQP
jgi:hypothetical protein